MRCSFGTSAPQEEDRLCTGASNKARRKHMAAANHKEQPASNTSSVLPIGQCLSSCGLLHLQTWPVSAFTPSQNKILASPTHLVTIIQLVCLWLIHFKTLLTHRPQKGNLLKERTEPRVRRPRQPGTRPSWPGLSTSEREGRCVLIGNLYHFKALLAHRYL